LLGYVQVVRKFANSHQFRFPIEGARNRHRLTLAPGQVLNRGLNIFNFDIERLKRVLRFFAFEFIFRGSKNRHWIETTARSISFLPSPNHARFLGHIRSLFNQNMSDITGAVRRVLTSLDFCQMTGFHTEHSCHHAKRSAQ
jgi:hypothetical protein